MVNTHLLDSLYEMHVANAILTDVDSGLELFSASLETHSIAAAIETEEIKAGQANATFVTLQKGKTITVELADIMSRLDWQAAKMNGNIEEKLVMVSETPKNYSVKSVTKKVKDLATSALVVELAQEPYKGILPTFYNKKTKQPIEAQYLALEGKVVTITDPAVEEGMVIFGSSYKYETTAPSLTIAKVDQTRSFRVELHIPIVDAKMNVVYTKKVIFHRGNMASDWSFEGNTEITKNSQTTTLTVVESEDHEDLGYIVWEPVQA